MQRSLFLALLCCSLTACSSDPYQGMYEGIKQQNDARRTSTENAVAPAPSYDIYRKEREKISP